MSQFSCGHPRTPANSANTGTQREDGSYYKTCLFCARVRSMVNTAIIRQDRINQGLLVGTRGRLTT